MKFNVAAIMAIMASVSLLASAQPIYPRLTVLANSIDSQYNADYIDALLSSGFAVEQISSADMPSHLGDPLIIILGGHHAPEGVGAIVDGFLEEKEKEEIVSSPNARTVRVVPNLWGVNQSVILFAGYSREQTRKVFGDSESDLIRILKSGNATKVGNYSSSGEDSGQPTDLSQLKVC
jgi:hypothetical protein